MGQTPLGLNRFKFPSFIQQVKRFTYREVTTLKWAKTSSGNAVIAFDSKLLWKNKVIKND